MKHADAVAIVSAAWQRNGRGDGRLSKALAVLGLTLEAFTGFAKAARGQERGLLPRLERGETAPFRLVSTPLGGQPRR